LKLIYRAKDITEAQIISGMLTANDIRSHVGGFYLQGGVGELSAMDFATISVADEDVNSAMAIIAEYDQNVLPANESEQRTAFKLPLIVLILAIFMLALFAVLFGGNN